MAWMDSPYPENHVQCRVGASLLPFSQLVGYLEGEATIAVRRFSHDGWPRPRIIVSARDDDATPFAAWRTMAAAAGRPIGGIRRMAEQRRNVWQTSDPIDVIAFLTFLSQGRPLLARTMMLIPIALNAAGELAEVESPVSPRIRERLGRLAAEYRAAVRADQVATPVEADWSDRADLRWWLSGLFAADGYLGLRDRRGAFAPEAQLSQAAINRDGLVRIQQSLGLGQLRAQRARSGREQWTWKIRDRDDCLEWASILDCHPMPNASPRFSQLQPWTQALRTRSDFDTNDGPLARAGALEDLYVQLRATKRYAGARLLCSCPAVG
jgi:hypothetical protein